MNTRKVILLLVIIVVGLRAGLSQPLWYFNNVYNPYNTWASGMSIIATETGYFGCAVSSETDPGFYEACSFLISPSGEMMQWKCFGRYGVDYFVGDEGTLIRCNNGYATFSAVEDWLNNDSLYGIFYRFDDNGDTLFTRYFNDDNYDVLIGRACASTSDGGFGLVGDVYIDHGYSDNILINVDSNGMEQWRNYLGTEIDDWAKSIIQTPDKGYAIGSRAWIHGTISDTADPMVYKTDSLGNLEWSANLGGPFLDDHAVLCNSQDSCIMVLTAYADSMYNPLYASTRINLIKLDLSGSIIWNKKYGSSMLNYISNIQLLDNGDVIACGFVMNSHTPYLNCGWLFRFNSDGDSLWYREYFHYPEAPPVHSENFLYAVSQSDDNGFVAVGQAYAFSPENPYQNMWVLKVDSVGCEIENCWVGVEEPGSGDAGKQGGMEAGGHGGLEIWPNPAKDQLHVRLNLKDGHLYRDLELEINDIFGHKVSTLTIPALARNGITLTIDVSTYSPGIYIAIIRENQIIKQNAKFIVFR